MCLAVDQASASGAGKSSPAGGSVGRELGADRADRGAASGGDGLECQRGKNSYSRPGCLGSRGQVLTLLTVLTLGPHAGPAIIGSVRTFPGPLGGDFSRYFLTLSAIEIIEFFPQREEA
jgi:hypothetical protein